MKKHSFFVFLAVVFVSGCASRTTATTPELPLEKGTTWIYSYQAYQQSAADPNQIAEAVYQLTETVVELKTVSPYLVAYVKKDYELVKADIDWPGGEFTDNQLETWYVMNERQVFESREPVDQNYIQTDKLILAYDFPLSHNKTWCLTTPKDPDKAITGCEFVGRREVTGQGPYETPEGKFEDCYDIIEYWNTGNFFQRFCSGVGVVSLKFDHAGTRFGFEQTLIDYSIGAP